VEWATKTVFYKILKGSKRSLLPFFAFAGNSLYLYETNKKYNEEFIFSTRIDDWAIGLFAKCE
jgi:hypothetical protein